ncbi:diaminopimelate epimerase [Hyphomicrobium sp. NDB2Meth4]|uniref:diaminopimelate epimerase n=1 Tax=Hyphomicrobium sp. NDB2Meth4 TaxID=1892846 RepID=UPI000931116B|nr:diaminopimelate epimerase [Hyphomicrobium sp. NDB2Meth4]
MTDTASIPFRKMNGLGNDFVVLDARETSLALGADEVRRIGDRNGGIGCDQIIVMEPSKKADLFMRIFNADGSEVSACGNATRCIALIAAEESGRDEVSVETSAGLLKAKVDSADSITIDMGKPRFGWRDIPLAEPFEDTTGIELQIGPIDAPVLHTPSVVNVGNPHAIFWVNDVNAHDLGRFGPLLENHPIFPERANISLAQVTGPNSLKLRTWERGAGLTRACGTAACAAAIAAARKGLTDRQVAVELPGGTLYIEWAENDHIMMRGPAELEFEGTISADTLSRAPV